MTEEFGTLDNKKLDELAQKIPILNLKSPIFVFWVGSFIFGAFGVNRFMTGQIWLGVLKLAIFLAHAVLFVVITSATPNPVANVTNEYLQNAFRLIGVNSFIVGILGVVIPI